LIQLIPLNRVPAQLPDTTNQEISAPEEIKNILKRSCYDCHSNALTYPWYAKIAPLSWYIQNHVKEGRRAVNFSTWQSYTQKRKAKILSRIPKALKVRMPLPDYLWLHPEAKLTPKEKKLLSIWAEKQQAQGE